MGKKRKRKSAKSAEPGLGSELDRDPAEAPKAKSVKVSTSFKDLLKGVDLKKKEKKEPERSRAKPAAPQSALAAEARSWKEKEVAKQRKKALTDEKKELLGVSRRGRPSEELAGQQRVQFAQAFAGVRPLAQKRVGRKKKGVEAQRVPPPSPAAEAGPLDVQARERLAALVGGGVRFDLDRNAEGELMGLRANAAPGVLRELGSPQATPEASLDLHGRLGDEAEREVARFVRAQHKAGKRRLRIVHGKGLHSEGGMGVLEERVIRALTEGLAAPLVFAFRSASQRNGGLGALMVELVRK